MAITPGRTHRQAENDKFHTSLCGGAQVGQLPCRPETTQVERSEECEFRSHSHIMEWTVFHNVGKPLKEARGGIELQKQGE